MKKYEKEKCMLETTGTKPLLRSLNGETQFPPPFWLMRQAGRYLPEYRALRQKASDFLDFCHTPDMACEAALQPLRRYEMDAAILFSDILTIPDALGQPVQFRKNEGPVLRPVRNRSDFDSLDSSSFHEKLAPVYQTVRQIRASLSGKTALIGFSGAPWTLACYMVEGKGSKDFIETRTLSYRDPAFFQSLIDRLTQAIIDYLSAQIDAGAEVIQLFDSWAGILDEESFERWVIEPTAGIVSTLRTLYPHVPIIGFPKGAGVLYEVYVRETKVSAISIDSSVPLRWAAEVLQPLCPVQGNLDPLVLLSGGDALDHAMKRLLRTLGKGAFVVNLGHGILPATPPENVGRLASLVRSFTVCPD